MGWGGFLNEVLNEVMGCAEQYVGARRCVKSRFGGVGIGWGQIGTILKWV